MKVLNIHERIVDQPKEKVSALIDTLAGKNDQVWPKDNWPVMKLDRGLQAGSKGGHGPIRYTVDKYDHGKLIEFTFTKPLGFDGSHKFELSEQDQDQTLLKHTIDMNTNGSATLTWAFAIKWLHNALIEDAFDNVENHFSEERKVTDWNIWVKVLRGVFS